MYAKYSLSWHTFAVLLCFFLLTGCAVTTTQTARQLEEGEVVAAATVDLPGWAVVPKVGGSVTYGLGGRGDVSAHAGSAIFINNLGVGGRFYPTSWLNLSLQADLIRGADGEPGRIWDWITILALTPRISTSITDNRPLYFGLQSNILHAVGHNERIAAFGAFFGFERPMRTHRGRSFQFELGLSPAFYLFGPYGGYLEIPIIEYGEPFMNVELSFSVNWRPGVEPEAPRPAPTPRAEDPEGFLAQAEPRARQTPEAQPDVHDESTNGEASPTSEADDGWTYSIERDTIRQVIRSRRNQFTACYEDQLHQDPTLSGQVTVSFVITDSGRVEDSIVLHSTLQSSDVESCILNIIDSLLFPELEEGEEIQIDYPFNFSRI